MCCHSVEELCLHSGQLWALLVNLEQVLVPGRCHLALEVLFRKVFNHGLDAVWHKPNNQVSHPGIMDLPLSDFKFSNGSVGVSDPLNELVLDIGVHVAWNQIINMPQGGDLFSVDQLIGHTGITWVHFKVTDFQILDQLLSE